MNISIKGLNINFEVYGRGEQIVFLHGWGANLQIWESLKPYLAALPFQMIFLDLPGFGESSVPATPFSSRDYAALLNQFFKELEIESPILLGHSVGGKIALAYALEYNGVKKMILIDSAGIRRRDILTQTKLLMSKAFSNSPEFIKKPLAKSFQSEDYRAAGPMKATMAIIVEEDLRTKLSNIAAPTLLIWGEEDPETPIRDAAIMKRGIKNSVLKIIPQCGHFPFIEQPALVAKLISEFIL
ncbi:MAG: alpha/beta hydrolase [Patescibacteria group bacterium]